MGQSVARTSDSGRLTIALETDVQPNGAGNSLSALIVEVATSLMGVTSETASAASDNALARLLTFFDVDHVFLRRNDHENGNSILVGEEPPRQDVPDPDPLRCVPFCSDPVFAATQHLKTPLIAYPETHKDYDDRVAEAAGAAVTFAGVPLLSGETTVGGLGLVKFGTRPWNPDEVEALSAVATMFAQLWGRLEAQDEVRYLAYFDALTGLPNRQKLKDTIDDLPTGSQASLLLVDVDNMKVINDGLTFAAGDQFLIDLGRRIRAQIRPADIVARIQGDQFGVLLQHVGPDEVDEIATRLAGELDRSVDLGGLSLARSVSIGIAHAKASTDALFAEASAALHQAKALGKKRAITFDETMRSRVLERFETELELRHALDHDELTLHYQPEVDLVSGHVVATEALLRWNHPTKGLLAAGGFIAAAEESGLIVEIGDVVLQKAVAQLAVWHETDPTLEMWINVSPAQLVSRDLATQVEMVLLEHSVAPDKICLELTEQAILDDIDFTRNTLERLRELGVKLALDDFGTGYSSLQQLKQLPITTLKIDMSFVEGLGVSEYDSAIVDAAITLADAFGLDTVAEGIEQAPQLLELVRRGCFKGQGYLMAKPAAPDDIVPLFNRPLEVVTNISPRHAAT